MFTLASSAAGSLEVAIAPLYRSQPSSTDAYFKCSRLDHKNDFSVKVSASNNYVLMEDVQIYKVVHGE